MSKRTTDQEAQLKRLRSAYDEAFREWTRQVQRLQSFTSQPNRDSITVKEATIRAEEAESAYRKGRNSLTEFMLAWPADRDGSHARSAAKGPAAKGPRPEEGGESRLGKESQVRGLAYSLWETAGRPIGSADEDWRRAEQLVEYRTSSIGQTLIPRPLRPKGPEVCNHRESAKVVGSAAGEHS